MGGRGRRGVRQSRRAVGRYRKWGGARAWRHFHLDGLVQGRVAGGEATKRRQRQRARRADQTDDFELSTHRERNGQ